MLLLKNGNIYINGEFVRRDILISRSIEDVDKSIEFAHAETVDLDGKYVLPGFIDMHCHVNGAGGEGGPSTRTAPLKAEKLLSSGTTSVVGLLGTDGYTRSLRDLLMHVRYLGEKMDAFMLTGSYQVPGPTLTGTISGDIILVPEVVGVKIALSDHRSSYPSFDDMRRLSSEVRVSSMLSGKRGIITVHLGDGKDMFRPIYEIIERTEIPAWHFLPTHIDRNEELLKESAEYGRRGGYLDITAHEGKTLETIKYLTSKNVPLDRITVSTDGNGSMPFFNSRGELAGLEVSPVDTLLKLFRESVEKGMMVEFVRAVTLNPAERLGLRKGRIEAGMDADLVVFDAEWNLSFTVARGRVFRP